MSILSHPLMAGQIWFLPLMQDYFSTARSSCRISSIKSVKANCRFLRHGSNKQALHSGMTSLLKHLILKVQAMHYWLEIHCSQVMDLERTGNFMRKPDIYPGARSYCVNCLTLIFITLIHAFALLMTNSQSGIQMLSPRRLSNE